MGEVSWMGDVTPKRAQRLVRPNGEFQPLRLILARCRRGWSRTTLAIKTGVPLARLYRMEYGRSRPSGADLRAISKATRFPADFFAQTVAAWVGDGSVTLKAVALTPVEAPAPHTESEVDRG